MATQIIPVNFSLVGGQTHIVLGYRKFGTNEPFTYVNPYPMASPYNLELPLGLYEIYVRPSCPSIVSAGAEIGIEINKATQGKPVYDAPKVIAATEVEPDFSEADIMRHNIVVNCFIPLGCLYIGWKINGSIVRESSNFSENFSIEDSDWSDTNCTIQLEAYFPNGETLESSLYTLNFTQDAPQVSAPPAPNTPPAIHVSDVTDTTMIFKIREGSGEHEGTLVGGKVSYGLADNLGTSLEVEDELVFTNTLDDGGYLTPDTGSETFVVDNPGGKYVFKATLTYNISGVDTETDETIIGVYINNRPSITINETSDDSVKFSWDASDNAIGYNIVLVNPSNGSEVYNENTESTEHSFSGLLSGRKYNVYVMPLYSGVYYNAYPTFVSMLAEFTTKLKDTAVIIEGGAGAILIQCKIGAAYTIIGSVEEVTGLESESTVITCSEFEGRSIVLTRGGLRVPQNNQGDGGYYFTKNLDDNYFTLSQGLVPEEVVMIEVL